MCWTVPLMAGLTMVGEVPSPMAPANCVPPPHVRVWPVFLVPEGEPHPTHEQIERLDKHLRWTQERYREMLHDRDTFQIVDGAPLVLDGKQSLADYRTLPQGGAPQFVSEVLGALNQNRFSTPYVFLIVLMNPTDGFPLAGGRPLNGGYNTGGGIVMVSSHTLDHSPNFQSTLQHELGHGFGLLHSNTYGFDQRTHVSIMSYNRAHHTRGFEPSETPGILAPEDIRALALNKRAFPKLFFDPVKDVPAGYPMPERVRWLGPQEIPGQAPYRLIATTDSGQAFGSKVENMLLTPVAPSRGPGITFDPGTMWHSGESSTGWVQADVSFPFPVQLSKVAVHSQHSGKHHAALGVRIQAKSDEGWREVAEAELPGVDHSFSFPATVAQEWRFRFRAGDSNQVVIRGLRFFSGEAEIFPPFLPVLD